MHRFCGYGCAAALFALSVLFPSCGGGGSSSSVAPPQPANWQLVPTPAGATAISFFAIGASNDWYIADFQSGFWQSTDQGSSWTQINSGSLASFHGKTIQVNPSTGDLIGCIFNPSYPNSGPVHCYRRTPSTGSWSQIVEPSGFFLSFSPALTGCLMPSSSNSRLLCGGFYGPTAATGFYSTDNGTTTTLIQQGTNSSIYSFQWNPITNDYWMGSEAQGIFRSKDGVTFASASPPSGSIRDGNIVGITYDSAGNVLFDSQGGIWKSSGSNGSYQWTNVLQNTTTSAGAGLYRDSNGRIYYGHQQDSSNPITIYRSTDGGATWQEWDTGIPTGGLVANEFIENPNDGKIYAVIQDSSTNHGSLYRSTR